MKSYRTSPHSPAGRETVVNGMLCAGFQAGAALNRGLLDWSIPFPDKPNEQG